MKFGINAWVWTSPVTTEELEKLAPKVAEMGFDMIEIPLEDLSDLDFKRGAEIIRECGLGVSGCAAMGPDRDLIHPDESVRQNGMAYLKGAIDACATLGATNLVGPLYSAVGRTWQQAPEERAHDLDILVENLSELARYAEERGVRLGLEPLNRFETSFINLAAQAREVVDRVGHPNLGIMLDTFHMNIEERDPGAAIRRAGDRLVHFHACGNDRGAPGHDAIDWIAIRDALADIDYRGAVSIESFTSANQTIATAASIWRPLAPTQDDIATEGLSFLRGLLGS